ncbi:MAG: nucleoside-diphosphate kinase [Chloroflexi bacterium]|nr:nucleoside-diphosphate kinase [Chloroflexota bacterium]
MLFLAVLKPDGAIRKASGAGILKGLMDSGLCRLCSFKEVVVPAQLLAEHYKHVSHRGFYPWLIRYMSSYPSFVIFVEAERENIENIRRLLGATRAHEAEATSLRYRYCPYGGANGVHLSEDERAGRFETKLWRDTLGIRKGQFDIPIEEYIDAYFDKPNHTLELRRIFFEIAKGNSSLAEQDKRIRELLREESVGASEDRIEFLYWVLTDQLE